MTGQPGIRAALGRLIDRTDPIHVLVGLSLLCSVAVLLAILIVRGSL